MAQQCRTAALPAAAAAVPAAAAALAAMELMAVQQQQQQRRHLRQVSSVATLLLHAVTALGMTSLVKMTRQRQKRGPRLLQQQEQAMQPQIWCRCAFAAAKRACRLELNVQPASVEPSIQHTAMQQQQQHLQMPACLKQHTEWRRAVGPLASVALTAAYSCSKCRSFLKIH
jgi:hypothetical protein